MIQSNIIPRPFQRQILDELSFFPGVGIFSKTGSGKTMIALQRFVESAPSNLLVLVPSHVVPQWERVIDKHLSGHTLFKTMKSWTAKRTNEEIQKNLVGKDNKNTIVVLGLQSASRMLSILDVLDDDWMVVVDESHRIKSPLKKRKKSVLTGRTQYTYNNTVEFVLELGKHVSYKTILTATPTQGVKGGYIDLYTQLRFLGVLDMPLNEFKYRYCIERSFTLPSVNFPIKRVVGYRDTITEIDDLLRMFTRSYSPKYTEEEPTYEKISISAPLSYRRTIREKYYEDIEFTNPSQIRYATRTLTGGAIAGYNDKREQVLHFDNTRKVDYLKEMLQDTDEVVVIIYNFNAERIIIEKMLKELEKEYILISGGTKDRAKLIEDGGYDVVLGQIKACGESLDGLQHKSHIMVLYSMPDSSLDYRQVLGRIYRDGQTIAPVYYFLVMENTIDEAIYRMIEDKVDYTSEMIDMIALEEWGYEGEPQ